MKIDKPFVVISMILAWSTAHASECQVSLPESGDLSDLARKSPAGFMWVGTEKLAAQVPQDGHWTAMGPEHNYRDKWWWWRQGYQAKEETRPELSITAKRLDGPAPPVFISHATNAFGPDWDRMLVGMEFPTAGCWEVIGRYHGDELRFVFKVGS